MAYVFPGITPFIERAAAEHELPDEMRSRIAQSWHVKAVANALAQLPEQAAKSPEAAAEVRDRLRAIREGLSAQLGAVDLAIYEVLGELGMRKELNLDELLDPEDLAETKPKPKRTRRTKAAAEPAAETPQEPEDEREEDESAD